MPSNLAFSIMQPSSTCRFQTTTKSFKHKTVEYHYISNYNNAIAKSSGVSLFMFVRMPMHMQSSAHMVKRGSLNKSSKDLDIGQLIVGNTN